MSSNPPEPAVRKSSRPGRQARSEAAEETAASLSEIVTRAEAVLERLTNAVADAEDRLETARLDAQRSIAAADELRQDVSSLIVALQGLATEVDAQVREHTVALMRTMSGSMSPADTAATQRATASVADEVTALIEELRATAEEISSDLEAKSSELRALIDEATRVRPVMPVRRISSEPATVSPPAVRTTRPTAEQEEEPLPSLRERARAVQDQFEPSQRPRSQDYGRYAEAVDLAARGVSADEIARRCGLGREEVRMLLRLRQNDPARR